MESLISFKGSREGIYIHIKDGEFETIKQQLQSKLNEAGNFFFGSNVINFKGKQLGIKEENELKSIVEKKYGIAVTNYNEQTKEEDFFQGIEEGKTKFIRSTIRSGQRIKYDGNLIVIGDVNAGGQVIANGNILVMGSLRGMAHAGCDGNIKAIVAAFDLQPTQLRIAHIIARKPDNDDAAVPKWPEVAKIEKDIVLIEPYLRKK